MKREIYLVILLVITGTLISSGCSSVKRPADVVKAFFMAGNEGNFKEAHKYGWPYLQPWQSDSDAKDWSKLIGNRKISKIEILKEEIAGGEATVFFKFYFTDGSSENRRAELGALGLA